VIRLLRGELIKVRTTRTALGFGAACVLLILAVVLLTILTSEVSGVDAKIDALAFGGVVATILMVFGAVGATGEFRHRTIAPAVLIAPDRLRLVVARLIAYTLTAIVFAIAMAIIALGIGLPLLAGEPGPDPATSDWARLAAGSFLACALATAIGVGYGTLVRNQVLAVVSILIWLLIVEQLLISYWDDYDGYSLLFALGRVGRGGDDEVSFGHALVVLLAWAVPICVAALVVDRRRDVE
jgi:ABC-2 type transport system permease protein